MSEKALTIIEQREVTFYDDMLTALKTTDGQVYVAISQMCEALGINTQAQRRRIERHEILNDGLQGVANLATPGGLQSAYVLRVDLVPLWLSGLRVSAVREEARPKLTLFQKESARVLWEAFQGGQLTADPSFTELMKQDTPAVQAYKTALAIVDLARSHVLLEARMEGVEGRLEAIESQLNDTSRNVTPDQASQISQAVKAIAIAQGKVSGRNEFGAVYGELYRKFGITSYKLLPANRFAEAMKFMNDWFSELTGESPF